MNETKTLTISEFLKARLREAEEAAKSYTLNPEAPPHSVMTGPGDSWVTVTIDGRSLGEQMSWGDYRETYLVPAEPNQQVLEDIMSKRAIVDLHCGGVSYPDECGVCSEPIPCATLRLLAAPYRRHPDYQEEWA